MELRTRTNSGRPVERRPHPKRFPATYGEKRPCHTAGCITRLHRYHEGEHCYACEQRNGASVSDQIAKAQELARRGYEPEQIAEVVDLAVEAAEIVCEIEMERLMGVRA